MLLFVERAPQPRQAMNWWVDLGGMWAHEVGKVNVAMAPGPRPGVGVDLRPVQADTVDQVAAYVTKGGIDGAAMEVARSDAKSGMDGSATPFQLGDRAAGGDGWALARWREYEHATRGVHRVRWARGFRDRLGLGREQTDREAADDTEDCEPVTELDDNETALVLAVPELGARVCEAAEVGGADAVHDYLRRVLAELGWRERVTLRRWARDRTGRARGSADPADGRGRGRLADVR